MRLKREGQKGKRRGYRGHKSSKLPYQRCSAGKWRQSRTFFRSRNEEKPIPKPICLLRGYISFDEIWMIASEFHKSLAPSLLLGNTNLIFLTIYYLRNDDTFEQLILLNFTLTKFTQKFTIKLRISNM